MFELGNLTIVLPSYKCDRNCPFCIAKNNKKFNNFKKEDFDKLRRKLQFLRDNSIKFDKLVLSGNGEPSLYTLEELQNYVQVIRENEDLFKGLRVHTSGNLFLEKDKFDLFEDTFTDVEYDTLRVALDPELDMEVLGYDTDYMKTETFKRAKKIKFDVGLTTYLDNQTFPEELEQLLTNNPNVRTIRFKNLMSGEHEDSSQAQWVRDTRLNKDQFVEFARNLVTYYGCTTIEDLTNLSGNSIRFEKSGNYPKDVVYSNEDIRDYKENPVSITTLRKMATGEDSTKTLSDDSLEK